MAQGGPREEVGGPAVSVGRGSQVLSILDVEPDLTGQVVVTLGFSEAGQARAGVGEVGEDVVDDLDGEGLEAGGGGAWRRG